VRSLTLSALAPRPAELLWDIGGGSGSISVEWALAGGRAICIEPRADRVANIRANAEAFGLSHRISGVEGRAPEALQDLPVPDAVFVGGGGDAALFSLLWERLTPGARLVANSVTLETETLLAALQARHGGSLLRIDLAEARPLGRFRGWEAARPVVQWSVVR
jgi:precorrin-6Y C5,15-methyltransferase (decarboxylating)